MDKYLSGKGLEEKYFENKLAFKKKLQNMINDFVQENKVVSIGDRVKKEDIEYEEDAYRYMYC
ncbi:MAG: hypothetical protein HY739_13035 [Desulfobacterales bacterium]|nr:hypothetical protein [Desulfobacterales bacterium]